MGVLEPSRVIGVSEHERDLRCCLFVFLSFFLSFLLLFYWRGGRGSLAEWVTTVIGSEGDAVR